MTYLRVTELRPSERNARTHSQRQIEQIAASIREFGFTNPILIDRTTSIIAGHGRLAAAKLLGLNEVPTICLEGLNKDQIRGYILADNRLAEKAKWDKDTLAIELEHLTSITDFNVEVTGFEIPAIALIIQEVNKKPSKKRHKRSQCSVTQSGDTWILGGHRIVCGESLGPMSYSAVDVAIRHWQKYTGDRAIHAITSKPFDEVAASCEVNRE